jgi:hypothetical protein
MYTHLQAALNRYRKTAGKETPPAPADLRVLPLRANGTRKAAARRTQTQQA